MFRVGDRNEEGLPVISHCEIILCSDCGLIHIMAQDDNGNDFAQLNITEEMAAYITSLQMSLDKVRRN